MKLEVIEGQLPARPDERRCETHDELVARAEEARQRADQLAVKLREMGVDPGAVSWLNWRPYEKPLWPPICIRRSSFFLHHLPNGA